MLTAWIVAVTFTRYLGVKLLPTIPPIAGGYAAIYETPNYRKFRRVIVWAVSHKFVVAAAVVALFLVAVFGMRFVDQQFFPNSDRTEILVDVTLPQGASIEATSASAAKIENWLKKQPETQLVTSYIAGGAPRFFLAYNPELPNPKSAKLIVATANPRTQARLRQRLGVRLPA